MRRIRLAVLAAGVLLAEGSPPRAAQAQLARRAPELTGAKAWLNTAKPLSLAELRGKVVLLDFWTYACINCMHVVPDLKFLEEKYAGRPFTVIGVHSAKFTNEAEIDNVRQAVLRYGITHPVAVDEDYRIWRAYEVEAWPTLVLIDPEGYVAGSLSGEGNRDTLDRAIGSMLADFESKGKLDGRPLPLRLEKRAPGRALAYPGKVLALEDGRLFVADTGNNRIVMARQDGTVEDVAGKPDEGRADGDFETARFRHPQGLAARGHELFVADTENHLVRRIDLAKRTVTTLAGTGAQGQDRQNGGPAKSTALNSPWDVALAGDSLYVAMAGLHQIWRIDLKAGTAEPFAGSGREDIIDGPVHLAALAQPSGLSIGDGALFVADAEVSGVRRIRNFTAPAPKVETLVGQGLFDFGDRDGTFDRALLQHPLGVAASGSRVYVADSFNHKLKQLDLKRHVVTTIFGTGRAAAGASGLNEPGGLSFALGKLFVADTNNHRIVSVDPVSKRATPVVLLGLTQGEGETEPAAPKAVEGPAIRLTEPVALTVAYDVEKPRKVNARAPRALQIGERTLKLPPGGAPTTAQIFPADAKNGRVVVETEYFVCEDRPDALCLRRQVRFTLRVDPQRGARRTVMLRTPVFP